MSVEGDIDEYDCGYALTAEQEATLDSLDQQYDAILREFEFTFPQLTEAQEGELERKMISLDAQYGKIFAQFDENLSESKEDELEKQLESIDAKTASIVSEFGFVEPRLTHAQEGELEMRLAL